MFHKAIPPGDVHPIQNWVVANAAARAALSVSIDDVGKVAAQIDTGDFYVLVEETGPTWGLLTATGGLINPMTTDWDLIVGGTSGAPNRLGLGLTGQALTVDSAGTAFGWAYKTARVISEGTTARTLALTDNGAYIRFTNTSAKTVTINPNSTTAYIAGTEFHIRNAAAGNLTLTPGSGVTLNAPSGGSLVLGPSMTVTVKRVGSDNWDVMGQTV